MTAPALRLRLPGTGPLLCLLVALAGLLALWVGCDLTNRPLDVGGSMNFALNPFGMPLVVLGTAGVALAPGPWLGRGLAARGASGAHHGRGELLGGDPDRGRRVSGDARRGAQS